VITENAADATSQGLEVEFTAVLGAGFELSGTYAYLDATYDEYLEPNGIDNAGNRLRNAPENAYSLVGSYETELGNGGMINARLEYIYSDERFQDPREEPGAAIPDYSLSNLNLMYTSPGGQYQVSGWVRNMFDEEYLLHNFPLQPFGYPGTIGMPRMYGATFTVNFGS
jgi:iron complex outermembrane receptor protein